MRSIVLLVLLLSFEAEAQRPTYGGKLNPIQANMDILHYGIVLDVNIPAKEIVGSAEIRCILKAPASELVLDLMDSFTVVNVSVNHMPTKFDHAHHSLRLSSGTPWPAGLTVVNISYGGRPMIAKRPPWDDGFTFTTDSAGHPWVAVTAEGTGGKIFFPAKDHPSDEPDDGVDLTVSVPAGLVVAGPGVLKDVRTKSGKSSFHWQTKYPINNYSIVFNIGDYTVVKRPYTTSGGHIVPMEFYVLRPHAASAPHLLEMMEKAAHIKEKYFGEYPWYKEKIGLVETPHLGMEHQTMNAYGNKFKYVKVGGEDYDWLMNHEFGHEWWGNKVTAGDWADYWIHEGIDSYGDALYVRELEGEDAYERVFQRSAPNFKNEKAIVLGKDIPGDEAYHPDIYGKGAFFMHTLRYVLGDDVFFPTLMHLATDSQYTYRHTVNTDDVEKLFAQASGKDLSALFKLYLYTTQKLDVHVRQLDTSRYLIKLDNLAMALPVEVSVDGVASTVVVDGKGVTVSSKTLPLVDRRGFYLKRVIYE